MAFTDLPEKVKSIYRLLSGTDYSVGVTQDTSLANTVDTVTAYIASDAIMNGVVTLTPKFQKIAVSATGTLVSAVSSKKIRILGFYLIANGTVNVNFQSHTTTSNATGLSYLVANTGVTSGFFPSGLFETTVSEALDIALSGSISVGGQLVYVEV